MIKKNYIEEYEINLGTNFIQGIDRNKCFVCEFNKEGFIEESVNNVINNGCITNGSTLEGRNFAASKITGFKYKPPIIFSESEKIILFPCDSHKSLKCLWINLKRVKKIEPKNKGTIIEFVDGKFNYFDISNYVINNQYNKALKLYYTMFEVSLKNTLI